jgi:prepilin-type N-terminal cleavage/methylation domain-containing protein/prepilin-type processing-associated H-X9-DG protein
MTFTTRRKPLGFSLIELLIVIAIIGLLVALSIPGVQAAREASRRAACANNLRQYGIAMHAFQTRNQHFPSGMTFRITGPLEQSEWVIHDYMADLLPYLEVSGAALYDYGVMFNHQNNQPIIAQQIPIGTCPSSPPRDENYQSTCIPSAIIPQSVRQHRIVAPLLVHIDQKYSATYRAGFCDYTVIGGAEADLAEGLGFKALRKSTAGIYGMFPYPVTNEEEAIQVAGPIWASRNTVVASKGLRPANITDGLSNTLMVVEVAGRPQHWRKGNRITADEPVDRPWADPRSVQQMNSLPGETTLLQADNIAGLYSFHPSGVSLLFADGHVELAASTTEAKQILQWMTPSDRSENDER